MIKTSEVKLNVINAQRYNKNSNRTKNEVSFQGGTEKLAKAVVGSVSDDVLKSMEKFYEMKKMVIINGSPRHDDVSNTYRALMAEKEYYQNLYPELQTEYFKLPRDMNGCFNCKTCIPRCVQKGDNFKDILNAMEDATDVMIGSPVYLDMPTPQTVAFLTRLNCMAESTERKFFANKAVHLVSTAFCSGTKTCIHAMMSACEMLGFTIKGRSSREYIVKWSDKKLRGGLGKNDAIWLK